MRTSLTFPVAARRKVTVQGKARRVHLLERRALILLYTSPTSSHHHSPFTSFPAESHVFLPHALFLPVMSPPIPNQSSISPSRSTFVPPILRRVRRSSSIALCHQHNSFFPLSSRVPESVPSVHHSTHPPRLHRISRKSGSSVFAVQTRPVSGDSDGEIHEAPTPSKSYSVGVTIVSGFDSTLRRKVIEKIVAESDSGRVVVVTTGGITSTDEPDGDIVPHPLSKIDEPQNAQISAKQVTSTTELNGHATSVPVLDDDQISRPFNKLEGWISCSSPEEMAEVVAKLSSSRDCDYIIAEGSLDNEMEPQELAQLLQSRCGASLRIDTLVSVLDGDTLLQDLSIFPSGEQDEDDANGPQGVQGEKPPEGIQDTADTRPMMVVSLVENANVIIVSQTSDSSQEDQLNRVQSLVSVLNDSANIVSTTSDAVPVDQLINTNAYDRESVLNSATWKKVLIASRNAERGASKAVLPKTLKDTTFVYRAKRPFHPTRLYEHIKAVGTFARVIRSTGRLWLATRMLAPLEWNQAGVAATLRVGKHFWAGVPETEWPSDEQEREKIMSNWDTQYGDRETEIVFVGAGIDKARLQGLLDGCLLQDEEMVFNNLWENFEDPFVEWVPLTEDDEEPSEDDSTASDVGIADQQSENGQGSEESKDTKAASESETREEDFDLPSKLSEEHHSTEETATESNNQVEGYLKPGEVPQEVVEKISALDIFEKGFGNDPDAEIVPQPKDDGSFDEADAVIASWDGTDADAILMQVPKSGLPVTIVTGFLGSGKTTLLNYILTADHGLRIAVLVNEFGEIDIDNQLVEKDDWSMKNEILELANGCICCSINDSFVSAVAKILERSDEVDYLIVETTGVTDPVPVIRSLMVSELAEYVRVDGVLTLVDAENFDPETQMGSEAAVSQIMAADTILLSKTDIASPEKVDKAITYIKSVRPAARILKSQRGRVPIHMILDVGLRVAESPAHQNPVKKRGRDGASGRVAHESRTNHETADDDGIREHHGDQKNINITDDHECEPNCKHESHSHSHQDGHKNHLDADGFVTTSFRSDQPLDPDLFMNKFLGRLPEGVFRAKGLLRFYGYGKRYVFQLSGRRYQFEEDEWPEGVAPGNQMVIIGRDLDLEHLRSTLESCLAQES